MLLGDLTNIIKGIHTLLQSLTTELSTVKGELATLKYELATTNSRLVNQSSLNEDLQKSNNKSRDLTVVDEEHYATVKEEATAEGENSCDVERGDDGSEWEVVE